MPRRHDRELGALNSVQTVDLAFNKLQSVPQRLFEKWISVETVRLNNNQLIELPASLGSPSTHTHTHTYSTHATHPLQLQT